jgi:hypothetical protein
MRGRKLTQTIGALASFSALVAGSFMAFVFACDVGFHLAAEPAALGSLPGLLVAAAVVSPLICAAVAAVIVRWSARSVSLAPGWIAATILGLVGTVVGALVAAVCGFLLASSTLARSASVDFFSRNEIVDASGVYWLPWLALLAVGLAAISITLLWGASKKPYRPRARQYVIYVLPSVIPLACVGALITSAMFQVRL